MSMNPKNTGLYLQTALSIAALCVAIAALIIAFNTEERNAERFERQLRALDQAEQRNATRTERQLTQIGELAKTSVRPLLTVSPSRFAGRKGVILRNNGLGAAVITNARFEKAGKVARNLADLFYFPISANWESYTDFTEERYFMKAGDSRVLVALSLTDLGKQGLNSSQSIALLESYSQQISGMSILFEYEDVLGNAQEPLKVSF